MPINYVQLEQDCKDGKADDVVAHFAQHQGGALDAVKLTQIRDQVSYLLNEAIFSSQKINYTNIYDLLNGKIPLVKIDQPGSKERLYLYLANDRAKVSEDIIQRDVNERFWRVKKPLKVNANAFTLYTQINQVLLQPLGSGQPIVLDGLSARSLILALTRIIAEKDLLPSLKFQIGRTIITCDTAEVAGRKRQKANFWVSVDQLPGERFTYGNWVSPRSESVAHYLVRLCAKDLAREMQLATLMIQKSREGSGFSRDDFNEHYCIKIAGEPVFSLDRFRTDAQKEEANQKIQQQIDYLNGLNFLRAVCEVTRRLYRFNGSVHNYQDPKAKQSDAMPIALLQARSLELLARGVIRLNDIFGESESYGETQWTLLKGRPVLKDGKGLHRAEFGVATGQSTIEHVDIMAAKADRINTQTEGSIVRPGITLFTSGMQGIPFQGPQFPVKEGHNLQRKLLGEHFGGDNESDASDYSDDEEVNEIDFSVNFNLS